MKRINHRASIPICNTFTVLILWFKKLIESHILIIIIGKTFYRQNLRKPFIENWR